MKRSILIYFIFSCIISLNAQKKLSLHANVGTGFYGFAKKEKIDFKNYFYQTKEKYIAKPGVNAGLELAFTLNPKWRLSTGINYQFFKLNKSVTVEHYDESGTIYYEHNSVKELKNQALQLPLQCSYFVLNKKNKLSIDLGFITSLLLGANFYAFEAETRPITTLLPQASIENGLDFLVSAGVTYQPFKQLAFRLSYEYDMADNGLKSQFFNGDVFLIEEFELRISALEFGIVYQLVKKKRRSL